MIGKRLLHYEIVEKLGEGGMGVVYKARDTHLDRLVAIKVLPPERVADAARKARFVQEAKAASALNHPNIVTIYDISSDAGRDFIAMEYVAGRRLDQLIPRQGMGLEEALRIAVQMAGALARAHAAGIIHRDLKPANVMVTGPASGNPGVAKLLDFGLAKLAERAPADEAAETVTAKAGEEVRTEEGTILGTVAYMSPEQVEAKTLDARSDVFSFGAVLYEMVTGGRAFHGDSRISTMSSILRDTPPPPRRVRPDVPAELNRILDRCLAKQREARYGSAAGLHADLAACQARLASPARRWLRPRYIAAALAVLAALGAGAAWIGIRASRRAAALDEIAKLAGEGKYAAAFRLAKQARERSPADPRVARLWEDVSMEFGIESDPPGADVEIKEYLAPENEWIRLGRTPLTKARVPRSFTLRWRLSRAGFGVMYYSPGLFADPIRFTLDPEVSVPEGMVRVPGATVQGLTGPDSRPRPARLGQYFLDRYEVTNRQFKQFMDAGGYRKREYWKQPFVREGRTLSWEEAIQEFRDATGRPGPSTWEGGTYPQGQDDYPVGGVSWYEAAAYAEFGGKSLPTIFHWQLANGIWAAVHIVPNSNFSGQGVAPAGKFQGISPQGAYDMAGNVREWVWNETEGQRYILGGAWNQPSYMSNDRDVRPPFDRSAINGFRCVRDTAPLDPALRAPRDRQIRDYSREKPVPDAVFDAYRSMYAYDRTPLNAKVEPAEDTSNYWKHELVTFNPAYAGTRVMAHLFLPRDVAPPFQTVVFFPGSGAQIHPSSRYLEGLTRFDYIIKSGRAFVYPIYLGTYERRLPSSAEAPSALQNRDRALMRCKDLFRTLDYLATRKDIDAERIGYVGFSWGGWMGPILCAVESRLKVCILTDGGFPSGRRMAEVDPLNFAPRVRTPTLMLNGANDFTFPLERSQKPMFSLLGTPEKDKRHVVYQTSHDVSVLRKEVSGEVLGWLDRYLGPVK